MKRPASEITRTLPDYYARRRVKPRVDPKPLDHEGSDETDDPNSSDISSCSELDEDYPMRDVDLASSGESDPDRGTHKHYPYRISTQHPGKVLQDVEVIYPNGEPVPMEEDRDGEGCSGKAEETEEDDRYSAVWKQDYAFPFHDGLTSVTASEQPTPSEPSYVPSTSKPVFILLMPAYASEQAETLSSRINDIIYTQAFGHTPAESAIEIDRERRLAIMVGFNRPRTPSKRINNLLKRAVDQQMPDFAQASGFFWEHSWVRIEKKSNGEIEEISGIKFREVRAFYKAKKHKILESGLSRKEKKKALNKIVQRLMAWQRPQGKKKCQCVDRQTCHHSRATRARFNPVPYRQIRDVLLDSPQLKRLVADYRDEGRRVYFFSFDADFKELRHLSRARRPGLFTTYTEMAAEFQQEHDGELPHIMTTGYRNKLDPGQSRHLMLDLASKICSAIRAQMARLYFRGMHKPAFYNPEPNSGFLVHADGTFKERYQHPMPGKRQSSEQRSEGEYLVANMFRERGLSDLSYSQVMYREDNPLRTTTPDRALYKSESSRAQIDFSGQFTEDEHIVVGYNQEDIETMMDATQSHASRYLFSKQLCSTVPFEKNGYSITLQGTKYPLTGAQAKRVLKHLVYRLYSFYHPVYCVQRLFSEQQAEYDQKISEQDASLTPPPPNYLKILSEYLRNYETQKFSKVPSTDNKRTSLYRSLNAVTAPSRIKHLIVHLAGRPFADQVCGENGVIHNSAKAIARVLNKHLCMDYPTLNKAVWHGTFTAALNRSAMLEALSYEEIGRIEKLKDQIFGDRKYAVSACIEFEEHTEHRERIFELKFRFESSILHLAAASGNKRLIKYLLQHEEMGLSINAAGDVKPIHCALMYCARFGYDHELITMLIPRGGLRTRLKNNITLIQFIIEQFNDPVFVLRHLAGYDAEMKSCLRDYERVLTADKQAFRENPVSFALECNKFSARFAYHLVDLVGDEHLLNDHESELLTECIDTDDVDGLLEFGRGMSRHFDLNTELPENGDWPLDYAAKSECSLEFLRELIDMGARRAHGSGDDTAESIIRTRNGNVHMHDIRYGEPNPSEWGLSPRELRHARRAHHAELRSRTWVDDDKYLDQTFPGW